MKKIIKFSMAAVALLACAAAPLRAQQVQAALAEDSVAVGQPVQMNLTITGGSGVRVPDKLTIEGLEVQLAGRSDQTQVTMVNGRLNAVTSAIYTYLIIPTKPGTYTIPAMSVKVGGRVLKTEPLTLNVGGTPGGSGLSGNVPVRPAIPVPQSQAPRPQSPNRAVPNPPSPDEVAFGEIVIPSKSAYVGEVIPVEIRYYFGVQARVLQEKPSFSGDGFTVMNFGQPVQQEQEVNGRTYQMLTFKTAITPAKSGTLEITSAELAAAIALPSEGRSDDFFGGILGGFTNWREGVVKTKPVTLEVKPLPKDGRPADFGGAIGQFSMETTAKPTKAAANDPITLNVTVSGRGNFDGMSPPNLIESDGWRTYPPQEKFTPSPTDPIGFNGEKRFEYMMMAREDRSFAPVAEFSFFDPSTEKYVTLKSPKIAVEAKGGSAPSSTTVASAATPAATPTPAPAQPSATPVKEVLVRNFTPATFQPFVESRAFLVANGALALTWFALLLFGVGKVVSGSKSSRAAAVRKEALGILHRMESSSCPPAQFYQHASDFVAARLGSHNRDALETSAVSIETKVSVGAILDVCDEMKFSTSGIAEIPIEERRRMVAQLKSLDQELR
jgi:hypothetical protein